ncbi:MAG: metallophosphoesterase [bacterium]
MPRLFFSILPLLILAYAYCGWKVHHALQNIFAWPWERVAFYVVAAIAFLNLYPLVLLILSIFGLKNAVKTIREGFRIWDVCLAYPFWFGLVLTFEVLPWLLALDFVKLPFYPFYTRFKTVWLLIQYQATLAIMAFFFMYVAYRLVTDTIRIRISKIAYATRSLPTKLEGLRIVHISDLQADPRTGRRKIKRYIRKVNRLKPDIVFFTGDLVTSGTKFISSAAAFLGNLKADYGVFACLGDHDVWSSHEQITKNLSENHVKVYEDKNDYIRIGFDSLMVTFVTNTYARPANLEKLNQLMGHQPRGALDILVIHQPTESIVELAAERGYHLFLAGHTHGGQVVFRPFGFTFALSRIETPFYRGIYGLGSMLVSINSGLGLTLAPVRYRAPAEITLIKIVRSKT